MLSSLLITLREGLEAALIVSIIAAFLIRTGRRAALKDVWIGVGAALALSAAVGLVVSFGAASLSERSQEVFEGVASLIAAGVLTWMIFWMRKQARGIKAHLESRAEAAMAGGTFALSFLAFTAVAREGLETVLFLYASFTQASGAAGAATGAVIGLLIAVALGYGLYRGGLRINLRTFFQVTGGLLIVVAAGLIAYGIHELNEAGMLLLLTAQAWTTEGVIAEKGTIGSILRGLFGYESKPTLFQVLAYVGYLVPVMAAFYGLKPKRSRDHKTLDLTGPLDDAQHANEPVDALDRTFR